MITVAEKKEAFFLDFGTETAEKNISKGCKAESAEIKNEC